MSFSREIKLEIIESKPSRQRGRFPLAYGLFLFSTAFSERETRLSTETQDVAELYAWFLRSFLGRDASVRQSVEKKRGRTVYHVVCGSEAQRAKLYERFGQGGLRPELLSNAADAGAFLSGVFLACGSMSEPEKSYHLEFAARDRALGQALAALLAERIPPGPGVTTRRGGTVVYLKECGQIEDLLTMMGAPRAALSVIDVEMLKEVRNRVNRVTNCETANIDKQVDAAAKQFLDIETVLSAKGETVLTEALLFAARLRLEYPEASLRELCELSSEPVSRSGLFHRYAAIAKIAERIRAEWG